MSYTWNKQSATVRPASSAPPKTNGYVPPAKREPAPKPFEEEFPVLCAAPAAPAQRPTLNFGEMMKATATGITTAPAVERIYVSGNMRLRVIEDDTPLPAVAVAPINRYTAKVRARAAADARARRRIFDTSSEEEVRPEIPDSDSLEDKESNGDDHEEEGETYDADVFDRHR